jgi:hypothetical protein
MEAGKSRLKGEVDLYKQENEALRLVERSPLLITSNPLP